MPGVLLMEGLAQAAGHLAAAGGARPGRARGPPGRASTRRSSAGRPCPATSSASRCSVLRRRGPLCRVRGRGARGRPPRGGGQRCSCRWRALPAPDVDPTARVAAEARARARACASGAYAVVGPQVQHRRGHDRRGPRGRGRRHHARAATTTSSPSPRSASPRRTSSTTASPRAWRSATATSFREFVTLHRGTAGGGGVTRIGSDNLFMAYAHVAHDCRVGSHTIFANGATLAGHVEVADYAHDRRLLGRAPVLPRGRARLPGRLHGGHQGRAARTRRRWATGACIYGVNTLGPAAPRLRPRRRSPPSATPTASSCRAGSTPATALARLEARAA